MNADTTRIVAKRILLTGHPFKVHKKTATVRYMFFNPGEQRFSILGSFDLIQSQIQTTYRTSSRYNFTLNMDERVTYARRSGHTDTTRRTSMVPSIKWTQCAWHYTSVCIRVGRPLGGRIRQNRGALRREPMRSWQWRNELLVIQDGRQCGRCLF